jgi:predicted glycoside hydrolase/deacetylase ChbG (UPF0249 family)
MTGSSGEKYLIVNADDFGMSTGINRAIIRAHTEGIVTSASLMVRWPFAREAAGLAAEHPRLSVGLHFDLGEWKRDGDRWEPVYEVLAKSESMRHVLREAQSQLREFRDQMGRDPTHLDSHQHKHLDNPARHALWDMGRRLGIPVRHLDPRVRYCGDFYGIGAGGVEQLDAITPQALMRILSELEPGTTELCTHPGTAIERGSYSTQRAIELETLSDPAVRAAIELHNIKLIPFDPPAPHPLASRTFPRANGWRAAWRRLCGIGDQQNAFAERSGV